MPALLGARLLVLDVIAGHTDLDEPADEVADVGVAAVPRVGVGDDERPEVDRGCRVRAAPRSSDVRMEVLVAVGGEQGADQPRRFVRHLAQRVAREIGPGSSVAEPLADVAQPPR